MLKTTRIGTTFVLLTLLTLPASGGRASDGEIKINQARALAGGITPGDAPGFPITLSQPGSYRLTGNLVNSTQYVNAIDVTADQVTIDLGGFFVSGTVQCAGYPPTSCTFNGAGYGIRSTSLATVVRNGEVSNMGSVGVALSGSHAVVEDVRTLGNVSAGIWVGPFGLVRHCAAAVNASHGILLDGGSSAEANEVHGNAGDGIQLHAVASSDGSLVHDNRSYQNGGAGIRGISGSHIKGNISSGNVGPAIVFGSFSEGGNMCSNVPC